MIRLGLTGGIGSGKSVVADFFNLCGIPVYDCDFEAKRLMTRSVQLRERLIEIFGPDTYIDGKLNRSYLAKIIFQNPERLVQINAAVHPAVRADYREWTALQKSDLVVVESAILFDSGLFHEVDKVLTVTAPEALRIQRVMQRDGVFETQVKDRMQSQMAESERISRSDYVVINDDRLPLIPQLNEVVSLCRKGDVTRP